MTATTTSPGVGPLLKEWRRRRRFSQLDLSLESGVSSRHLSFVETGRSRPSRELLLHLAEHLDVPLRERNALLLAAGYAPAYDERALDSEEMAPVRVALDQLLRGHEPFPAVVVDRRWDLVSANASAAAWLEGVAPELLEAPVNVLRASLHPAGLAPRILNFAQYSEHLLLRLHRQATLAGDAAMLELYEELREYPDVREPGPAVPGPEQLLFVPLKLLGADGTELSFFSTISTFGTALDVTLSELAIESFFPADAATESALRSA